MNDSRGSIGFDIDGTLKNFELFVLKNGVSYFKNFSNFAFEQKNLKGYDLDQVYDLKNQFFKCGFYPEQAEIETEKTLSSFWNIYYLKYCFFTPFRDGAREFITDLYKDGYKIDIYTSRKKTCENSLLGSFVRFSTKMQFVMNDTPYTTINFFENDDDKIEGILTAKPIIMVDDKPEILQPISKEIDCICVNSSYNCDYSFPSNVNRIDEFDLSVRSFIDQAEKNKLYILNNRRGKL